jgi:hypothetical protein
MALTSGNPLWPILNGLPAAYPRLHHDLRCDGITFSYIAANLLLDRLLGRRNPDAELFESTVSRSRVGRTPTKKGHPTVACPLNVSAARISRRPAFPIA